MDILKTLSSITTFVLDMDGVLTDGSLLISSNGEYQRTMDIKDGYALQHAIKSGYNVWIITGSHSTAVEQRLQYLGVTHFYQNCKNKLQLLQQLATSNKVLLSQCLYVGDDVPDIEVMQAVGLSCCPKDAAPDVLAIANYITTQLGGKGCVRHIIEKTMKLQQKWQSDTEKGLVSI